MTDEEKITRVQTLLDNDVEATNNLISVLLDEAKDSILSRMYPFKRPTIEVSGVTVEAEIPSIYDRLQCKLAVRYFLRRGGEGQTSHNENGINRTYGSVNDEDLLQEVMQVVNI